MAFRPLVLALALILSSPVLAHAATAPPAPERHWTGLKKTVAVESFQAGDSTGGATTGEGLAAMLGAALAEDGRFVVVERAAFQAIQNEQLLAAGNATTVEGAPQRGQLLGASYIVRGTVTKYDPNHGSSGLNVGGLPLTGALGLKKTSSYIELSLRVIDTTTGEVISVVKADGLASSHDVSVSATARNGQTISSDNFKNTPIAHAAEAAIKRAIGQIETGMERAPWSALVVENADNQVVINAGSNQNLQVGTKLHVFRKGRVLTDPSTGQVLDVAFAPVGTVDVRDVREKISIASVVDGQPPARGDILRY
jgi:curli biogenesis system outer membrane secretion channel CsgG